MKVRTPFAAVLLAATTAGTPSCPSAQVRPTLANRPGLVTVFVPNRAYGNPQACPVIVYTVDVGAGKIESRMNVTIAGMTAYLPPNPTNPKAGCIGKGCPRAAVFLTPPGTQTASPISSASAGLTGDTDPCSGNPMMEGSGGSGVTERAVIQVGQSTDSAIDSAAGAP